MNMQQNIERHSALNTRGRKMATGGNRSWTEDEVIESSRDDVDITDPYIGKLSSPDPDAENAI
jgi:hypothetical protein